MDQTTRRDFLKQSAVTAAVVAAPLILPARARGANGKLGVAVIGAGGMGGYAVDAGLRENMVAMCDIDDKKLAEAMKRGKDKAAAAPAPKAYFDYRKMLDECKQDIDVVLISTPDHVHAPAAMYAMKLGKHVFVQKPLAHDIAECHALAAAAVKYKVLTQMGNQGHCGDTLRRAIEYVADGAIGPITETHTILGRNFGGKGARPASKPVPPGVHWNEWIGPSPYRDYHDGLHPFNWRSWRDFGTGTIGDMACHNMDCLFFALKVAEAKTFTVECLATNGGSDEMWAQSNIVKYVIPARAGLPELTATVYDNTALITDKMKQVAKDCEIKLHEDTLYFGEKGMMMTTGTAGSIKLLPLEKDRDYKKPPRTLPRAHGGPIEDLFWCIKNNGTPASNFPEAATPLTAFVLTGHLAQNAGVGKKVEWDVEKMECTNMPELNKLVKRSHREGWDV